jgi:hypothetical protein
MEPKTLRQFIEKHGDKVLDAPVRVEYPSGEGD